MIMSINVFVPSFRTDEILDEIRICLEKGWTGLGFKTVEFETGEPFDYKKTLWSSWTLVGPEHRVFYSGDSGYSKLFADIGQRFGPFDLTVIKIGAYGPGQSWLDVHMLPEDAVKVHLGVGGKVMLPVHWATFNLAVHAWDEPIIRASKAARAKGVQLLTPQIGQVIEVDQPFETVRWWRDIK